MTLSLILISKSQNLHQSIIPIKIKDKMAAYSQSLMASFCKDIAL